MGPIRLVQIITCFFTVSVTVRCQDVDRTKSVSQSHPRIRFEAGGGGGMGSFLPDRGSNGYLLGGINNGPLRERRPGGLSYETGVGRYPERRGKALERRQLRYAKRLGKSIAKFSKKLLRQLLSGEITQDFVLSPLGVHMALSMASVGAKGTNLKEMSKLLGLSGSRFGKGNIHHVYFTLRNKLLSPRQDVKVIGALGVFVKSRIPLEWTFSQTVNQFYNGHFGTFSQTPVADINSWASNQTEGEISDLLTRKSIRRSAEMALTSVMCLKGYWNTPFSIMRGQFLSGNGRQTTIDMMEQTMLVRKMNIPDLNLVQLQAVLSKDDDGKESLVLDVILMNCTDAFQNAVEVLTTKSHLREIQRKPARLSRLVMPKFAVQDSLPEDDFRKILTKLKMRKAFKRRKANFLGISSTTGLYLQKVFHQSAIQFNEFGIGCAKQLSHEAIPGTRDVTMQNVELRKSPPKNKSEHLSNSHFSGRDRNRSTITVDRMFMFAIREMHYGTFLTTGIFTGTKDTRNLGVSPLDSDSSQLKWNCLKQR